ncbi:MAG: response regulator, partial [Saprospiraceae bacterium]|nr:response regulator [Saprospiraceae bacterium]
QIQTELLVAQSEKLKELDKLKTNLFANISHEFRTPLTLIKAPVEKLEKDPGRELTHEEVLMIRRNSDRLLRLVNQLLDLAKIDASSLKLDLSEGDLFRFLKVEASSFSSLASQKYIDYRVKIPNRQFWAAFDREKVETIVYNLLNNAFKFTPPTGTIGLTAEYYHSEMVITVEDDGEGMAEDQIHYIFDRFYQIEAGRKVAPGGTGIGLALCKELSELMAGKISVSSRTGEGSKFTFSFPVQEILSSPSYDGIEMNPLVSKAGFTLLKAETDDSILIVEDHDDMRHYLASSLSWKYPVLQASDGKEGLEMAIMEVPDLIITDTMMPLMDGHELSSLLKADERTSHIPIIMLTAKATHDNKLKSLYSGADSYLTKPFNADELEASIQALLQERKRLRKSFSKQLLVSPKDIAVSSVDQKFMERVMQILETEHVDSTFGVPQMQKALTMSKTQLHRKLKAISNQAPGEFLRNFRLQRAAQILSQKGDSVAQVAFTVGFENIPYFTKCFKELFGVSPSQYKK